jgi:hypothetical protein
MYVFTSPIGAVEISERAFNLRSVDFEHVNLDLAADETLFGQRTGDRRHVRGLVE